MGNCKQVCITPIWAPVIRAGDGAKEISRDRLQGIFYGTLRHLHLTNQGPCLTTLNMEHEKRNESPVGTSTSDTPSAPRRGERTGVSIPGDTKEHTYLVGR